MPFLHDQRRVFFNFTRSIAFVLLAGACSVSRAPQLNQEFPAGAWQAEGQAIQIRFEPDRVVIADGQQVKAMKILERRLGTLVVRIDGVKEVWSLSREGGELRFGNGAAALIYRPLRGIPPELSLDPIRLGAPAFVTPEEVQAIQTEILRRVKLDQSVRTDPTAKEKWPAATAENSHYLKSLVQRVGWISSDRFGKRASAAAVLLAKHSSDPRLIQAILPLVQEDVQRAAVSAELFSVLYDDLRLTLGEKQRYGTQIFQDEQGPYVLPLEVPDKVEEFRKAIGLEPLTDYLATASKYLYDGKPIRMPRPDE